MSRSSGSGLFSGGAQRTAAAMRTPISRWPSPAATLVGRAARPQRYSEANRKSPLRSPVKIRPVRLPPWAAGASPRMRIAGAGSPQPGIGRPQYGSSMKDLRRTAATSSRQATRRGQARHTDCRAVSSARPADPAASERTSAGLVATGVAASAGSSGHPVPGAIGPPRTASPTKTRYSVRPESSRGTGGPGYPTRDQAMPSRMSCSLTSTSAKPNRVMIRSRMSAPAPITSTRPGCMTGMAARSARVMASSAPAIS